ncbi:PH domain-containing protein [Ideonella sp. 4Y16]|uniref:photosynthetic complex putative assembly protein PuhB n=1 Tax=Ideonella alba TaxID=2824118 RepID=UPI001B395662|nr:photosynthetic complex putative assembly protein PuhB [Ideonella alba]MBQ0943411.1 PH domain-containing protein [Ideonella alba]
MNPGRAREHHSEPQPGLPERLPAGERLLWQGAPDARVLARRGFHLGGFALYFAALLAWRTWNLVSDGAGAPALLVGTAPLLGLAVLALGFIAVLAWLVERTTLYTLTDRRLVLRIGIVLTVSFNLPLTRIEAAELRRHPDGSGDLSLRLLGDDRIGVMHLWPHCRPWRFARAEPMLRALPDVDRVAALLGTALSASLQPDQRATSAAPTTTEPAALPGHLPHAA